MISAQQAPTNSGHMEHVRFYPGIDPETPSTIVGLSEGISTVPKDSGALAFLVGNNYEISYLSDDEVPGVIGSLSLLHIDVTPPLDDATLQEFVPMMLEEAASQRPPHGVMAIDNRHAEIPADRSMPSGPILGSVF